MTLEDIKRGEALRSHHEQTMEKYPGHPNTRTMNTYVLLADWLVLNAPELLRLARERLEEK